MELIFCKHCGTRFSPAQTRQEYCCSGCEYVAKLIHEEGFDRFYELKDQPIVPVGLTAFEARDYGWLLEMEKMATPQKDGSVEATLSLQGLSCLGCVWLIEKLFERQEGSVTIRVNTSNASIYLRWRRGVFNLVRFAEELQRFGYTIGQQGKAASGETRRLIRRIGLCAAFALNNMLFTLPFYLGMTEQSEFAGLFHLITAILATMSLVVGGSYFIQHAIYGIMQRAVHMDLPISLGILAGYIGSMYGWLCQEPSLIYFDFVSIFIFLMLLGRWVQEASIEKNQKRLLKQNLCPQKITVLPSADAMEGEEIAIHELKRGQILSVKKGELIPVGGSLLSPSASLSLSWINGESDIRHITLGQLIPSGAIHVGKDDIRLQVRETWEDSLLYRLTRQNEESSFHHIVLQRVLKIYTLAVLVVAVLAGIYWAFYLKNPLQAFQVFISLLIVSCPCAIGVTYPMINEIAVLNLQKAGVFIRTISLWGRLRRVRKIIFDKTGTLTLETPILTNPDALQSLGINPRKVLFKMVSSSLHPVCRSLRAQLLALHPEWAMEAEGDVSIQEFSGVGLKLSEGGNVWSLGKVHWRGNESQKCAEYINSSFSKESEFCFNQQPLAAFAFADTLKEGTQEEISRLAAEGYDIYVLSGDRRSKLEELLANLHLSRQQGWGEMSPDEKASWIQEHAPHDAMMIGDGANDSLAFEKAVCRGTPIVDQSLLEQKADFYFVGQNIRGIRRLLEIAEIRMSAVYVVFLFAVTYNISVAVICIMGLMNPFATTVLMPLSAVAGLALATLCMKPAMKPIDHLLHS